MAHRMRFTSSTGFTEARRELAAEVRDLADRLDSQEPDHSASHDAWEVLVELAEQAESLRAHFFGRHPEQEAWLTEERPWLDPNSS
jgi:phosphoribosyl 1,2-cyclic phosphodiesterase